MGEINCILAKTVKGKRSSIMENKKHWHYWNSMNEKEIEQTKIITFPNVFLLP